MFYNYGLFKALPNFTSFLKLFAGPILMRLNLIEEYVPNKGIYKSKEAKPDNQVEKVLGFRLNEVYRLLFFKHLQFFI